MYKLQNGETYHPLDGYAQSMFANIIFAKSLAQRSIVAFSAYPGSEYDPRPVDSLLSIADTKNNVQTYVSTDEVASWRQRKKEGEYVRRAYQSALTTFQPARTCQFYCSKPPSP